MDWLSPINAYCERGGPQYWAEPVNAVTNLAFLLSAFIMWRRVRGLGLPLAMAQVAVLAVIGVGSWLFHTHANRLTSMMDVLPILGFILLYIYSVHRDVWGMGRGWALAWTAGFVPYAAALVPLFAMVPGLGSSSGYMPVPLLIAIHAALLWRRHPATARGLAIGAGILIVSLTFRTLDGPVCGWWPLGTHFMWHILNAVMLGWMIEVYRRHMLAARARRG